MRVVLLLTQDRGGPADLAVALAKELATHPGGPDVTVIGPPSLERTVGLPASMLSPATVRSKVDASGFRAVSRLLRELAPDIVHAHDHRAGLVSLVVAGGRMPVLLTFHGVPDSAAARWVSAGPLRNRRPGLAGAARLALQGLVARRVTCTIAPSQAMGDFLRRELKVPGCDVRVIRNGIALTPSRKQVTGVRTFATAGSFAPCKATPMLVGTFLALAARHADLRLRMIGDGKDRPRCEELARQEIAGDRVEFTGFRTDVPAQLEETDAFVLPSLNENLPLALLQAMALGLPCVATDVGGVREVIDADCGVLIPPGDDASLRAAMALLINDPELASRLGLAASQRVREQFSLGRCVAEHVQLWQEIVGTVDPANRRSVAIGLPLSVPACRTRLGLQRRSRRAGCRLHDPYGAHAAFDSSDGVLVFRQSGSSRIRRLARSLNWVRTAQCHLGRCQPAWFQRAECQRQRSEPVPNQPGCEAKQHRE